MEQLAVCGASGSFGQRGAAAGPREKLHGCCKSLTTSKVSANLIVCTLKVAVWANCPSLDLGDIHEGNHVTTQITNK